MRIVKKIEDAADKGKLAVELTQLESEEKLQNSIGQMTLVLDRSYQRLIRTCSKQLDSLTVKSWFATGHLKNDS